ncbi:uncharacterized protein LOC132199966 [Neocloeon triangulifer]|uniref:uncharacterized protein LOC132199966 n=1 Tax=Neocloeon triangulifer TaxID=2078957 RepID=UPI00286F6160|nr:uncharacterized protein LOC132199966 [Neocloeon triangulifer]
MSLQILDPESVDFDKSKVNEDLNFKTKAVSWYTTRNALRCDVGFCGQDDSAVRYLHLPKSGRVNFNLNRTHPDDDFKLDKYTENEDISDMLSWVQEIGSNEESFDNAEFICIRHELVDLLLMPYATSRFNKGVKLYITKAKGKIYIRGAIADGELQRKNPKVLNDFELKRTKHGLMFQHFTISDSPTKAPVPDKPYRRGESTLYIVFEGAVGEHKLLYASKVKALNAPDDLLNLEQATFTDVRTNLGMSSSEIKWRKWFEWWGNCITGKMDKVAVGFVGKGSFVGQVKNFEIIPADSMIKKCEVAHKKDRFRTSESSPKGQYCIDALDKVLSFFKSELKDAKPSEVYVFNFDPSQSRVANLERLGTSGEKKIFVMPDWYANWLKV